MNVFARRGYDLAMHAVRAASLIAPRTEGKLLRSLASRRGIRSRFQTWAAKHRDRRRPLVWMHAPSVGEGLQARPVIEILREQRPDVQLIYTFYSPSAERFAETLNADFTDYLPFDTRSDARAAITAISPTAMVYSKLDIWPNFTLVAALRGVRLGIVSATVSEDSSRRGSLARSFLREAYTRLDAVGAASEEDAQRVIELGARPEVVFVTGDARYDQVWSRAQNVNLGSPVLAHFEQQRPMIVAGSTWPADERHILPAFHRLIGKVADAQLIIAPHEPSSGHVQPILQWARQEGISAATIGKAEARSASIVVVDSVGVLGDLYALADVAFVGGGFHSAGLHSVIEPAAYGVPVLFGPEFRGSRDAMLLISAKGGSAVRGEEELYQSLRSLMADEELRAQAGERARDMVRQATGAAQRSFELVDALINH